MVVIASFLKTNIVGFPFCRCPLRHSRFSRLGFSGQEVSYSTISLLAMSLSIFLTVSLCLLLSMLLTHLESVTGFLISDEWLVQLNYHTCRYIYFSQIPFSLCVHPHKFGCFPVYSCMFFLSSFCYDYCLSSF